MEKIIIGSPNIEGNIGSCEVKSTEFNKNFYTLQNIQTNSCTGEIVGSNTFLNPAVIFSLIMFMVLVFLVFVVIKNMYDKY
jgi:hypothetical protein